MTYNINNFLDTVAPNDTVMSIRDANNNVVRSLKVDDIGTVYLNGKNLIIKYKTDNIILTFASIQDAGLAIQIFQSNLSEARKHLKKQITENSFDCINYFDFREQALNNNLTGQKQYMIIDVDNHLGFGNNERFKVLTYSIGFIETIVERESTGELLKVILTSHAWIPLNGTKEFIFNTPLMNQVLTHNLNMLRPKIMVLSLDNLNTYHPQIIYIDNNTLELVFSEPVNGKVII